MNDELIQHLLSQKQYGPHPPMSTLHQLDVIHVINDPRFFVVLPLPHMVVNASRITAVSIRWTGLGTGLWDWTVGLDSQKVALILSSD